MIKKIYIFTLLLFTMFLVSFQTTHAEIIEGTAPIYWATDYVAGTHIIRGSANIANGTESLEINILRSDYHEYTYNGLDAYMSIRDSSLTTLAQIDMRSLVNFDMPDKVIGVWDYVTIYAHLPLYVDQDDLADMYDLVIWIPQNYASIPSGYLSTIQNVTSYDYEINTTPYAIGHSTAMSLEPTAMVVLIGSYLPTDARYLAIFFPQSQYNAFSVGDEDAEILLIDYNRDIVATIPIDDFTSMTINLLDYADIGEIYRFVARVPQTFNPVPNGYYINWYKDNTLVGINADIIKTNYWINGESTLYTYNVGALRWVIDDPADIGAFEFQYWSTSTGERIDVGDTIKETWLSVNNELNLYAIYRIPTTYDLPTEITPSGTDFETILSGFGMNNTAGHLVVYVAIILIVSLVLLAMRAPMFLIALINIIITGVFIYIGLIINLVAFIMVFIYIAMMILSFKGGQEYE